MQKFLSRIYQLQNSDFCNMQSKHNEFLHQVKKKIWKIEQK